MSTKAMKRLGITFMVIGIAGYALGITAWFSVIISIMTGHGNLIPMLYFIFAVCAFIGMVGYGAIPLLIMAHIRNKREKRKAEATAKPFCPYCGSPCNPENRFCGKCGNKLI